MMRLAGFDDKTIETPPKQLSIWAREVYGELDNLSKDDLDKFIKLLVVRHPFERLLSAYRDKLENSSYGWYKYFPFVVICIFAMMFLFNQSLF